MNNDFEPDLSDLDLDLASTDALSRVLPLCLSCNASNHLVSASQDIPNGENIPAPSFPSNLSFPAAEKTSPSNSTPTPPTLTSTTNEKHIPITTSKITPPVEILIEVNTKSWPDWLCTWYRTFCSLSFGNNSVNLVHRWTVLEQGYGFKSPICICSYHLKLWLMIHCPSQGPI